MSITVKELKAFLDTLPPEFDSFEMSNGEVGPIPDDGTEPDGEKMYYRLDKPIVTLTIDEENQEFVCLHQEQSELDELTN